MQKTRLLYLGLVFLLMVMYAPGGIASLLMMNLRVAAHGKLRRVALHYVGLALASLIALIGVAAMIEMLYHLQLNAALGPQMHFLVTTLDAKAAGSWVGAVVLLLVGVALFEAVRRRFRGVWGTIQEEIDHETKLREAAP